MVTIHIKYKKAGSLFRKKFSGESYDEANYKLTEWRAAQRVEIVELEVK